MSEHPVPYIYSIVSERFAVALPVGSSEIRYRGRCTCGWTTHLAYSSPASALTAVRRTHNALAPSAPGHE